MIDTVIGLIKLLSLERLLTYLISRESNILGGLNSIKHLRLSTGDSMESPLRCILVAWDVTVTKDGRRGSSFANLSPR
jgi:hypothetical protein